MLDMLYDTEERRKKGGGQTQRACEGANKCTQRTCTQQMYTYTTNVLMGGGGRG